jgi:hypothetical protein
MICSVGLQIVRIRLIVLLLEGVDFRKEDRAVYHDGATLYCRREEKAIERPTPLTRRPASAGITRRQGRGRSMVRRIARRRHANNVRLASVSPNRRIQTKIQTTPIKQAVLVGSP